MTRPTLIAAALLLTTTAQAAYKIEPIGEPGAHKGCIAIDGETELGFVAAGQSLAILVHSELLRLRKGDPVDGTWNVDGGKEYKLDASTDTANTVSADVPQTKPMFDLLRDGNTLNVTLGATNVEWSLAGSSKALQELGACMDKNVKP